MRPRSQGLESEGEQRSRDEDQLVECLPGVREALGFIPSTALV